MEPVTDQEQAEPVTEAPAPQEATDLGVAAPAVNADNLPTVDPSVVEPVTPPVKIVKRVLHRTRYTWNVYHSASENAPAFTLSLVENDPEQVSLKFWEVLSANVSMKEVHNYKPRLKSLEVLD